MAWLEYGGRLRKLPEGTTVVGSGPEASLPIEEADLMPRHFVLEPRQDHVSVAAFSPDVVVCLSGKQIGAERCRAEFGEPIQAGSAEFRVWLEQPSQVASEARPAARAYLVHEQEKAAYPLDRLVTSIGRSSANVVRLHDPTASRFHAQIRREAGGFALHVVGSAGGTINGRRVSSPRVLDEGDVVELAYAPLRFTRTVPEGVQIIPVALESSAAITERPTVAKERFSLAQPRPGRPPHIVRTAVVLGVLVAVGAVVAVAIALLG